RVFNIFFRLAIVKGNSVFRIDSVWEGYISNLNVLRKAANHSIEHEFFNSKRAKSFNNICRLRRAISAMEKTNGWIVFNYNNFRTGYEAWEFFHYRFCFEIFFNYSHCLSHAEQNRSLWNKAFVNILSVA